MMKMTISKSTVLMALSALSLPLEVSASSASLPKEAPSFPTGDALFQAVNDNFSIEKSKMSFLPNSKVSIPYFIYNSENYYLGKNIDISNLYGYTFKVSEYNRYNGKYIKNRIEVLIDETTISSDLLFDSVNNDATFFIAVLQDKSGRAISGGGTQSLSWYGHLETAKKEEPSDYQYFPGFESGIKLNYISNSDKSIPFFSYKGRGIYLGKDLDMSFLYGYTFKVVEERESDGGYLRDVIEVVIDDKTTPLDLMFNSKLNDSTFFTAYLHDKNGKSIGGEGTQSLAWYGHRETASEKFDKYEYENIFPLTFPKCKDGFECGFIATNNNQTKSYYAIHKADVNKSSTPLFVHFGGPEGSEVQGLFGMMKHFPKEVRDNFDIVAIDDIGTGYSSGGSALEACSSLVRSPLNKLSRGIENSHLMEYNFSFSKEVKEKCHKVYNKYDDFSGTIRMTEAWEKVRQSLYPSEEISILGISYGGKLAATYNYYYPQHTRAVVYDSSIGINESLLADFKTITTQFGSRLKNKDGLGLEVEKLKAIFDSVYEVGEYTPAQGRKLTTEDAVFIEHMMIFADDRFLKNNNFDVALNDIAVNDSTERFSSFKDKFNSWVVKTIKDLRGKQFAVRNLITCIDSKPYSMSDIEREKDDFLSAGIFLGRTLLKETESCTNWDYRVEQTNKISTMPGNNKAIIVFSKHDRVLPVSQSNDYINAYGTNRIRQYISTTPGHMIFNIDGIKDKVIDFLKDPTYFMKSSFEVSFKENSYLNKPNCSIEQFFDNNDSKYKLKFNLDFLLSKLNAKSPKELDVFSSFKTISAGDNGIQNISDYVKNKNDIIFSIKGYDLNRTGYTDCPAGKFDFSF